MADGNGLFEEMRKMLDTNQVPDDLSRQALWGALAVVYKKLDCYSTKIDMREHKDSWKRERRYWVAVGAFLLLTHLSVVAQWGEAFWKFVVAL